MDSSPPRLTLVAIDLALVEDQDGEEWVVLRLIDETGVRIDAPMKRDHAAAFATSLADYASPWHIPAWVN